MTPVHLQKVDVTTSRSARCDVLTDRTMLCSSIADSHEGTRPWSLCEYRVATLTREGHATQEQRATRSIWLLLARCEDVSS